MDSLYLEQQFFSSTHVDEAGKAVFLIDPVFTNAPSNLVATGRSPNGPPIDVHDVSTPTHIKPKTVCSTVLFTVYSVT